MTTTTEDRPRTDRREGFANAIHVEVQLWLAVLFMAVAFGAGVIVHAMAAPQTSAPAVVGTTGGGDVSGIFAPPLSDDQVSAGLPAGHPDIDGGSGTGSERPQADGGQGAKGAENETGVGASSP